VRDENDPGPLLDQGPNGGQRLADPGVIDDPAVFHRDVEIDADEGAFALEVEVSNGRLLEAGDRGQFNRSPR
jgi:hypothetical protein